MQDVPFSEPVEAECRGATSNTIFDHIRKKSMEDMNVTVYLGLPVLLLLPLTWFAWKEKVFSIDVDGKSICLDLST